MACGRRKELAKQQRVEGILLGEERVMLVVAMVVKICSEIMMKRFPKHKRT